MSTRRLIPLWILLVGQLVGCGGGADKAAYDKALKEFLAVNNEYVDIIDTVRDEATALAAAPRIDALVARADGARAQLNAAGEPSKAVSDDLNKDFDQAMKTAMARLDAANNRLRNNPQLLAPISTSVKKFSAAITGNPPPTP